MSVCDNAQSSLLCACCALVALVFWSAMIRTYIRMYSASSVCVHSSEIDALNRKRLQLIQDFKRVRDGYLAAQEVARERGRQERERKVEEKKLKEVEKKSRETLLPR